MNELVCNEEVVESMRLLILGIASALVDHQDLVDVAVQAAPDGITLQLRVAPDDLGKIIGKRGRTARSLRTVLSAVSMKIQQRYVLDVAEGAGG
jgi:predicted RNA-binding protein YlqC (UPF0109 family)